MSERELRRIPLKEEFVALTGDYIKAIILAQLEYWQKRAREFDKFLQEEKERNKREGVDINVNLTHGWIYKSAQDLSRETMLGLSKSRIRSHLKQLIDMGYVKERPNPYYKWDRTMQYRLDLVKIKADLNKLGYELQEWVLDVSSEDHTSSKIEHRSSTTQHGAPTPTVEDEEGESSSNVTSIKHTSSKTEHRGSKTERRRVKNGTSKFQNRTAIPDITDIDYYSISTPPYNPPPTHKGCKERDNSENIAPWAEENGNLTDEIRGAIYRSALFELFDNLGEYKTARELVEEAAARACKDVIMNRTGMLTELGVKLKPTEVAEQVGDMFPYGKMPADEEKRRKFFVSVICDLTTEAVCGAIRCSRDDT